MSEKITENKSNTFFLSKKINRKSMKMQSCCLNTNLMKKSANDIKFSIPKKKSSLETEEIEKMSCYLCTHIQRLAEKKEWKNLNGIGIELSERTDKKLD